MTINSLNLNQSQPFSGLGTATFNVVTTGLYTMGFKSSIPALCAGDPVQSTVPSPAAVDITLVADSSGNLNNKFFTFGSAGDTFLYYVWYNINSAGTDPAVAGRVGIQVTGATNATAATLATATRAAILASAAATYVSISGATTHVILTQKFNGLTTAAANGSASAGFSYSVTAGSYGVPASSGLSVVIKNGTTVLASYGLPTPTQQSMGGSVLIQATAADVLTMVISSLSASDNVLNAVKTVINLFAGE